MEMCFFFGSGAYSLMQTTRPEGILAGVLTLGTTLGINYLTNFEYKFVILALIATIATFTKFITCYILRRPWSIQKFGNWAIITGSTDGIGKAMAIDYAKKGLNIVLISRTQSKLDAVAKEVKDASGGKCEVITLAIDFVNFTKEQQEAVAELAKKHKIRILVNNVGMSYPYAMYYHETTIELQQKLIRVNCDSMALMTKLVLPTMKARRNGFVVNVSSGASVTPHDYYVGYASCKAYVNKFTEEMNREYNDFGIFFQCQIPLFVASKMSKLRRSSMTVASPEQYAKACRSHFGHPGLVSPFFMHAVILLIFEFVPTVILENIITRMHGSIRKRALRKIQKNKAMASKEE